LGSWLAYARNISLIEQIGGKVKTSERKVSCGKGTQAMILNALGFVGRALYMTPGYLNNKPVDLLIGPDMRAANFNDGALDRCLDDLYAGSSFHLHGAYDRQEPEQEAPSITYGKVQNDAFLSRLASICAKLTLATSG
jgi:hypothetical protein